MHYLATDESCALGDDAMCDATVMLNDHLVKVRALNAERDAAMADGDIRRVRQLDQVLFEMRMAVVRAYQTR